MTTMVRLTIDLPATTKLLALQRLAQSEGCYLRRRDDGTFVAQPIEQSKNQQAPEAR